MALLAGLLAIGACDQDRGEPAGEAGEAAAGVVAAPSRASPADPAPAPARTLALSAEGLVLAPSGGEIAFGARSASVENAVEPVLGTATARNRGEECGAGPMDFIEFGELTLNFQDGRFVGWFADEGARVPTADGIRPGVSRAELESERSVEMLADSTLDWEFVYALPDGGEIGGFLDGPGPEARVAALYAGTNCFFR